MNDLLCCCCPSGPGYAYDVSYSLKKTEDKKGVKKANKGDRIPYTKEEEMEPKVNVIKRSVNTSYTTPRDNNANAKKAVGDETKRSSSYFASHSVTKVTISSSSTNRSTNVVNEEVVSSSAARRKVDLPDWMIGIRSSRSPHKRMGGQIDLEPQFAGMFETEKKEEPNSSCNATEVIEEIYPVQDHRRSPVLFLESLDGDRKGDSGAREREKKVPFDDKLFNIEVSGAPKTRSHRETRRGVYERSISPAYKKEEEPALNLHNLDTIIKGNQITVESGPPESNGLLQTQTGSAGEKNNGRYMSSFSIQRTTVPKRTEDREGPVSGQETDPGRSQTSSNSHGANEEVVTMSQDRRKIDMPDWFLPNPTSRTPKDAGSRVDLERKFAGMFDVEKKERNPYQTRRGVYERRISPESKKTDESAVNLHHLDTVIPRRDQVVVESQPPSSSGPSTHNGRSYVSSYSVQRSTGPKPTEDRQSAENQETNAGLWKAAKPSEDVDEAVVTVSEDHRKVDIPDWFLPNRSSKPAKRFGRDADIERQFDSMIKAERKQTSTPKGTEVVEEIYPVEAHTKSPVLFLESLEGDHKGNRGAEERKRDIPLDDKLFDTGIPNTPKDRSYRDTRRKVYEKRISAEAKTPDQHAVNLNHLDTLIPSSNQKSEESQRPRRSNAQPRTDKKEEENDKENQGDNDDDDEYTEEIILVECNRKLRLPRWFIPHEKKEPISMDCLNDIVQVPQASAQEQHSAPQGGTQVDEELLQEIISDDKARISLHHLLKN